VHNGEDVGEGILVLGIQIGQERPLRFAPGGLRGLGKPASSRAAHDIGVRWLPFSVRPQIMDNEDAHEGREKHCDGLLNRAI
jgi:hypothetical protein